MPQPDTLLSYQNGDSNITSFNCHYACPLPTLQHNGASSLHCHDAAARVSLGSSSLCTGLLTMPMLTARIQLAVDHNNNNNVSIKAIKLCNLRLQSCCHHEAGCWRDEPVSRLQQFVRIARSGPAPLGGWCRATDCEDSGPTRGGDMIRP